MKINIELPAESAKRLLIAYERNDPELNKYLAPLNLSEFRLEIVEHEPMPLEIQTNNAPVLRQKADPVQEINAELRPFIEDMFETMYEAQGIGLAAPQVGVSKRVIVIDIEKQHPEYPRIALINPVITMAVGEELGEEGCLSLPGVRGIVRRAAIVKVEGLLPNGDKIEFDASDLMARALQHEIDHLNGILFTDLLLPEDQELLEPQPESSENTVIEK